MSPLQDLCWHAIRKASNRAMSTNDLAHAVKTSRVAVCSAMRALERKGKAKSWRHGNTQWAALYWILT